jgi:hypothetical protein
LMQKYSLSSHDSRPKQTMRFKQRGSCKKPLTWLFALLVSRSYNVPSGGGAAFCKTLDKGVYFGEIT